MACIQVNDGESLTPSAMCLIVLFGDEHIRGGHTNACVSINNIPFGCGFEKCTLTAPGAPEQGSTGGWINKEVFIPHFSNAPHYPHANTGGLFP